MKLASAAHLSAFLLFAVLAGALHIAVRDPYRIYCEDIEHEFLPQKAYTYQHPWEAFAGRPTPGCSFGSTNYLTHGGPAAALPIVTALVSRVAPRDPRGLALFEWRITGLFVLLSMAALFLFLRLTGADVALAAAVACCYPFAFTTFTEWRHADLTRGRLMIAPVLLGLVTATRFGGYRGWLLLAATVIACMAQASQFYWVAALVAYWTIAHAWLERDRLRALLHREGARALRHAGPPAAALAVVAVVLGPMYLRVREAMAESALFAELSRDPLRLREYFEYGSTWFSLAGLLTLERGFLPWSVAGLCLWAGVALWGRRTAAVASSSNLESPSLRIDRVGLPLFLGSLLLAFIPDLVGGFFGVREGRLAWTVGAVAVPVPVALALLFHTAQRTWLVLAETGGLIAGVAAITWWTAGERTGRDRRGQLAAGVAVFTGAVIVASWISSEPWPGPVHWRALAAVAAILAAGLGSSLTGRARRAGQAATIALGVILAMHLSATHYRTGSAHCRGGNADAVALLARDDMLWSRIPPEIRGLREHRLLGEKWCYYLDASCALSYPLRTLPHEVLRFFAAAGAVEQVHLPYGLSLDYPRLLETGLSQMLGIRWWIVPRGLMDGGLALTEGVASGDLHLLEARGAFDKGWVPESWDTASGFERALHKVVELGSAGELRQRGVVQTRHGAPLDTAMLERTAQRGVPARVELLQVEPARLRFRVRGGSSAILATNEFFHADWKAAIDGRRVAVWRVNAAFVGAAVPAGDHEVIIER
jgi:hypothetical protein